MPLDPDAPRLADWITVPEAAELLGMSKQGLHKHLANGTFESLHCVGIGRNFYVLAEEEVREYGRLRKARGVVQRTQAWLDGLYPHGFGFHSVDSGPFDQFGDPDTFHCPMVMVMNAEEIDGELLPVVFWGLDYSKSWDGPARITQLGGDDPVGFSFGARLPGGVVLKVEFVGHPVTVIFTNNDPRYRTPTEEQKTQVERERANVLASYGQQVLT